MATTTQNRIHLLPAALVNQIAAGEVIERPASVVKELVENAVDAGATRIEVRIEAGGTGSIQVVDDGAGIDEGDLRLAVTSHATSKIARAEDLLAIGSLGFRGEALASIASVSDIEVASRPAGQEVGMSIRVEAGGNPEVRPDPIPGGTRVDVRNLFYNTPARRKFLASEPAEARRVREEIERQALGNLHCGFRFFRDGQRILDFAPAADPRERIAAIYGRELARDLLRFEGGGTDAAVCGFVSPPHLARHNRSLQQFVLNGRVVEERILYSAVREGFRGHLMVGRHPMAFLFLAVQPDEVDVNVHPRKAEVRFLKPRRIFALVRNGIAQILETVGGSDRPGDLGAGRGERDHAPIAHLGAGAPAGGALCHGAHTASRLREEPVPLVPAPKRAERTIQIHDRYILRETPDGLEILDPHALHERILYARFLERTERGDLPTQPLLVPAVVELDPGEARTFARLQPTLAGLGFQAEPFGDRSVIVRAVPAIATRKPPGELLRDLLHETADQVTGTDLHHELLARIACKAAVKFGDPLTPEEIEDLLAQRVDTPRQHICPHGRPTAITMSLGDLDRRFGRK